MKDGRGADLEGHGVPGRSDLQAQAQSSRGGGHGRVGFHVQGPQSCSVLLIMAQRSLSVKLFPCCPGMENKMENVGRSGEIS